MPLTKLQFKPGIISDITSYSNEGGFVDGDKVRFRFGFPEKFGGWTKYSPNTIEGSARRLHNWVALDGSDFLKRVIIIPSFQVWATCAHATDHCHTCIMNVISHGKAARISSAVIPSCPGARWSFEDIKPLVTSSGLGSARSL